MTIEGSTFHVVRADGTVVPQAELAGLVLTLGAGGEAERRIRIDAVTSDPRDPTGEVMLYSLSEVDPATGDWRPACLPDPDGRRAGFPLPGAFDRSGVYHPAHLGLLITCTGGAEGKCVRFGYKPWGATREGVALLPYYQACVRLVRADYGGDGEGHTRNGTPIDIFDHIGVQPDEPAPGMTFEAAFGPDGALCVAHPRLPDVVTLSELSARYPRLAGAGEACSEDSKAILFVRSRP